MQIISGIVVLAFIVLTWIVGPILGVIVAQVSELVGLSSLFALFALWAIVDGIHHKMKEPRMHHT